MIGINALLTAANTGSEKTNGIGYDYSFSGSGIRWTDPRLIVLVINNRDLNHVTWEQRAMAGAPKFPTTQDLQDLPYAEIAS